MKLKDFFKFLWFPFLVVSRKQYQILKTQAVKNKNRAEMYKKLYLYGEQVRNNLEEIVKNSCKINEELLEVRYEIMDNRC